MVPFYLSTRQIVECESNHWNAQTIGESITIVSPIYNRCSLFQMLKSSNLRSQCTSRSKCLQIKFLLTISAWILRIHLFTQQRVDKEAWRLVVWCLCISLAQCVIEVRFKLTRFVSTQRGKLEACSHSDSIRSFSYMEPITWNQHVMMTIIIF